MKQLVRTTLCLACSALASASPALAHGGTYRGPGDIVPPGGGGRHNATPFVPGQGGSPGSGPSSPSPTGPSVTGGGVGTGAAAIGATSGVTTGGGASLEAEPTLWTFWWEFNKDPYLGLKDSVYGAGVRTGGDVFFLGQGERERARDTYAPSPAQIHGQVVPALLRALEEEDDDDIVTGAMMALAKIGDTTDEAGGSQLATAIAGFLDDPAQEVAETAALALGRAPRGALARHARGA